MWATRDGDWNSTGPDDFPRPSKHFNATELDFRNAEAFNNVGFALYRLRRLEESVTWYRRTIAGDAVLSPRRDLLVALTGDSLYAARVEDGRIRPPALVLGVRRQIVMEEWALGRHVERWTREVRQLLDRTSAPSGRR